MAGASSFLLPNPNCALALHRSSTELTQARLAQARAPRAPRVDNVRTMLRWTGLLQWLLQAPLPFGLSSTVSLTDPMGIKALREIGHEN